MIEYKGYVGVVEYDPDVDSFHGRVVNTRDVITFYGNSIEELKKELAASIEEYLVFCADVGKEPDKPYSGSMLIRTTPAVHREVATAAAAEGTSMNDWAAKALERAAKEKLGRAS